MLKIRVIDIDGSTLAKSDESDLLVPWYHDAGGWHNAKHIILETAKGGVAVGLVISHTERGAIITMQLDKKMYVPRTASVSFAPGKITIEGSEHISWIDPAMRGVPKPSSAEMQIGAWWSGADDEEDDPAGSAIDDYKAIRERLDELKRGD